MKLIKLVDQDGNNVQAPQERVVELLGSGFGVIKGQTVTLADAKNTAVPVESLVSALSAGKSIRLESSDTKFGREAHERFGGAGGAATGAAYGVGQGLSLGFGGKILTELGWVEPETLAQLEHAQGGGILTPIGLGEVAGTVGGAMLGGGALRLGAAAGRAVTGGAAKATLAGGVRAAAAPVGRSLARAVGEEAAIGAAYGAGSEYTQAAIEEREANPWKAAGIGAAIGGGIGAVGHGIGKTLAGNKARRAENVLSEKAAAAAGVTGVKGGKDVAEATLVERMASIRQGAKDLAAEASTATTAFNETTAEAIKAADTPFVNKAIADTASLIKKHTSDVAKLTVALENATSVREAEAAVSKIKNAGDKAKATVAVNKASLEGRLAAAKAEKAALGQETANALAASKLENEIAALQQAVGHIDVADTLIKTTTTVNVPLGDRTILEATIANDEARNASIVTYRENLKKARGVVREYGVTAATAEAATSAAMSRKTAAQSVLDAAMGKHATATLADIEAAGAAKVVRGAGGDVYEVVQAATEARRAKAAAGKEAKAAGKTLADATDNVNMFQGESIAARAEHVRQHEVASGVAKKEKDDLLKHLATEEEQLAADSVIEDTVNPAGTEPLRETLASYSAKIKENGLTLKDIGVHLDANQRNRANLRTSLNENSANKNKASAILLKINSLDQVMGQQRVSAARLITSSENLATAQSELRAAKTLGATDAAQHAENLGNANANVGRVKAEAVAHKLEEAIGQSGEKVSQQEAVLAELRGIAGRRDEAALLMNKLIGADKKFAVTGGTLPNTFVPLGEEAIFARQVAAFNATPEARALRKAMETMAPGTGAVVDSPAWQNGSMWAMGAQMVGFPILAVAGIGMFMASRSGSKTAAKIAGTVMNTPAFINATTSAVMGLGKAVLPIAGRTGIMHKSYTFPVPAANKYVDEILAERKSMNAAFDSMIQKGGGGSAEAVADAQERFNDTVDYLERLKSPAENGGGAQDLARAVAILQDPGLLTQFVKDGSLRAKDVELLKKVSPEAYDQLRKAVEVLHDSEPKKVERIAPMFNLFGRGRNRLTMSYLQTLSGSPPGNGGSSQKSETVTTARLGSMSAKANNASLDRR